MHGQRAPVGAPLQVAHVGAEDVALDGGDVEVAFEAEEPGLRRPDLARVQEANDVGGQEDHGERDDEEDGAEGDVGLAAGGAATADFVVVGFLLVAQGDAVGEEGDADEEEVGGGAEGVAEEEAAPAVPVEASDGGEGFPADGGGVAAVYDDGVIVCDAAYLCRGDHVPEGNAPLVFHFVPRLARRLGEDADEALEQEVVVVGEGQACECLESAVRLDDGRSPP